VSDAEDGLGLRPRRRDRLCVHVLVLLLAAISLSSGCGTPEPSAHNARGEHRGATYTELTVPNVVGSPLEVAVTTLRTAGCNYVVRTTYDPTRPAGIVVEQTPDAGSIINTRTAVEIIVSSRKSGPAFPNP